MDVTLDPDLESFINAKIQKGEFESPDAFLTEAIRIYRELEERHVTLKADVQQSLAQANRGDVHPLDTEATKAEARRRFAAGN